MEPNERGAELTPEDIVRFVKLTTDLTLSLDEAYGLLPQVRAQREALARLERFDVGAIRTPLHIDPRMPFRR